MEKYATYSYFKNKETGEVKKVALHEEQETPTGELLKTASKVWVKIEDKSEESEIESQK